MHPVCNQLIQLQELTQVREEHRVAGDSAHLEQINAAIKSMTAQLPADVRVTCEKLKAKDSNVIVPMSDGNCSVCGMQLPRSGVQQVKLAETVQSCPNCARFLYAPAAIVRNVRKRPGRFDKPKPGVARFSSETLMVSNLKAKDKEGAITELAELMEKSGFVDKGDVLIEEALRREALYSTAVDHGLAFPHVRGVEGGALTLAVGLSRKGIMFDGSEDEPTHIVFFLVIPTAANAFYLKLLAGLTETYMSKSARDALLGCEDAASMWKTIIKTTRKYIK